MKSDRAFANGVYYKINRITITSIAIWKPYVTRMLYDFRGNRMVGTLFSDRLYGYIYRLSSMVRSGRQSVGEITITWSYRYSVHVVDDDFRL